MSSTHSTTWPPWGVNTLYLMPSQEVHARGWHLLGDLTTNHCGDTHPWFRRALEDTGAPEREFFYFPGPHDNQYESWLGHSTLPKFRFSTAELRRRLLEGPGSVAGRWLRPPYDLAAGASTWPT